LVELIYNSTLATNGFDQYGHFGRTFVSLTNCLEYEANREGSSGCNSNFNGENAGETAEFSAAGLLRLLQQQLDEQTGGTSPAGIAGGPTTGLGQADATQGEPGIGSASQTAGTEPLLDYLLGP
jgi:hypothetical protein